MTNTAPPTYRKTSEVAEVFDLHPKTIVRLATKLGIGRNMGGKAGFRFTEADLEALDRHFKIPTPVQTRRRPRRAS